MGGAAGGAAAAATPAELERTIAWTNAAFTALIAVTLGVSFGVRDSTLLVDAAEAGEGTPSFAREFDAVAAAACMALAVGCWLLRTRTQNAAKRVLADAVTSNLLHVGVAHVLFRYSRALTLVSPDSGHRIPVLYFAGILVAGVDAAITMVRPPGRGGGGRCAPTDPTCCLALWPPRSEATHRTPRNPHPPALPSPRRTPSERTASPRAPSRRRTPGRASRRVPRRRASRGGTPSCPPPPPWRARTPTPPCTTPWGR